MDAPFAADIEHFPWPVARLDRQLRYLRVNRAMELMHGLPRDAAIGKTTEEVGALTGSPPQSWQRASAEVFETGEAASCQLLLTDSTGVHHYTARVLPEFALDGRVETVLTVAQDITAQRIAEKAVSQGEDRFRHLANSVPAFVWTTTVEGGMNYANVQWYSYTGLTRDQMEGFDWINAIHPDDREPCLAAHRAALKRGYSYRIEVRNRRADGCYRWFLAQAEPMRDAAGVVTGWFVTATDIDDLKKVQEDRARLLAREKALRLEAEALTRAAQDASRAKDEFLATLSHELRTPLNAILGWTQTLQGGTTRKETLLRALVQIEQSAQAQTKLIDDLLNVSDIVAGRLRLDLQRVRLVPVINAAVELLHPAIDAQGLRLHTTFDPDADAICGDPVRVQQIVWNLLSNAVKFTQRGGHIRIELSRDESHAQITIADSGEGISPAFLPYVFDRFRQADASSRKRHGGLGLGLAIARHLAQMHGGTVAADSPGEGQGATFKIRLPLHEAGPDGLNHVDTGSDPTSAASRARRQRLDGMRILTVDDDRNTREMLHEALERAGAEVVSAESARDALEKLQRFRPDVVVSDIGMPREDGYDFLRQVRVLAPDKGGTTPAIALTGYARDEDRAATRAAGYQAVTSKPVNLDQLLSTIARVSRAPPHKKFDPT